ncbi:hypothetical protein B0T18DRAFT_427179 [Schizothecium vesticola]|uniref:Uncharacterized protein n=1 Tax=Schizothecium vesticola TaxID=314040 RepID=A0AA40F0L5_9PEZI|nr:hypothetical protein B0T18DRAFT_427179 [Schizothecium vesticola]
MKLSALVGAALQLATLAAAGPIDVKANEQTSFLIYGGFITQKPTGNSYGVWAAYPDLGDCKKFSKLGFYFEMSDVSHDKGVACDGEGCLYKKKDPVAVDRLEINAYNDKKDHYTWYKNRDNHLVDFNDKVVGTCLPAPNVDSFVCSEKDIDPILDLSKADMKTFFRCNTNIPIPFW